MISQLLYLSPPIVYGFFSRFDTVPGTGWNWNLFQRSRNTWRWTMYPPVSFFLGITDSFIVLLHSFVMFDLFGFNIIILQFGFTEKLPVPQLVLRWYPTCSINFFLGLKKPPFRTLLSRVFACFEAFVLSSIWHNRHYRGVYFAKANSKETI